MGTFLETEKPRQTAFKTTSPYFSDPARTEGEYKGKLWPFCLPREYASENLFSEIRQTAIAYFAEHGIKWHDGQTGQPSNHLCDSQVCCVNFLFPFANKPNALVELLHLVFPNVQKALPLENQCVSFEWIGQQNYLGERVPRGSKRTRGANCTSSDAAVMFERTDGLRQIVLIEWKYTESYSGTPLKVAASGIDRTKTYVRLFEQNNCPLNKELLPSFDALFFEPFYQFMRQQFLANEMERAKELGASIVSVLHVAPAHNSDFRRVTSPELRPLGDTAIDVWKRLIRTPDRFISISTEDLFGRFPIQEFPELLPWWEYVAARYTWIK